MIDLHSHILPGIDDGSSSLEMSIEMALIARADGITHMACTPHILPAVYENDTAAIKRGIEALSQKLAERGIDLPLFLGADIHVTPDLVERVSARKAPTLNGSRYFLFEPPHHVRPPGLEQLVARFISRGYVPVVTHPERLAWIEYHYDTIRGLEAAGALLQLTAASITGGFGKRAKYWSERMLEEGRVALIASDAHHPRRRPPILSKARELIARRWGEKLAANLTFDNPRAILLNEELPVAAGNSDVHSEH